MYHGAGFLAGRCVIPIRDEKGRLVAYAGRAVNGEEPKYRFPAGFRKSQVLFNLDRAMQADGAQRDRRGRIFRCAEGSSSRASGRGCVDGIFFLSTPVGTSAEPLRQRHVNARWRRTGPACRGVIVQLLTPKVPVNKVELPNHMQPDQLSSAEINVLVGPPTRTF